MKTLLRGGQVAGNGVVSGLDIGIDGDTIVEVAPGIGVDGWGLTRERAARLREGALVMHAGPMNRGVELDWDVAELPVALITDQVTAGVATRMALLYTLLGSAQPAEVSA